MVLSDEFSCTTVGSTNSHNDVYYAYRTKDVPPRPTTKYPLSESRLGVITSKGALPLIEIKANPSGRDLQLALEQAIPAIERLLGTEYVLLHDLSPAFTCTETQQYLEQHVTHFFSKHEYPPQSPDINAIENVLSDCKSFVHRSRPRNRAELRQALLDGWAQATTAAKLNNIYNSMPERIDAVIAAKGGNTRF